MEASKLKSMPLERKIDAAETALCILQTYLDDPTAPHADLYLKDALEYVRQALSGGTQTTVLRGLRKNK